MLLACYSHGAWKLTWKDMKTSFYGAQLTAPDKRVRGDWKCDKSPTAPRCSIVYQTTFQCRANLVLFQFSRFTSARATVLPVLRCRKLTVRLRRLITPARHCSIRQRQRTCVHSVVAKQGKYEQKPRQAKPPSTPGIYWKKLLMRAILSHRGIINGAKLWHIPIKMENW